MTSRLRSNLEIVNDSSRVKLKADPRPSMYLIRELAETTLRHHETLALSTWRNNTKAIRAALEDIEDIYDSTEDPQ